MMTKQEKQLLLQDLCARLPYETRVRYIYAFAGAVGISGYSEEGILSYDKLQDFSLPNVGYEKRRVDNILSYLRTMSSMTEEECKELGILFGGIPDKEYIYKPYTNILYSDFGKVVEWFISHHFDYLGLIEKGLALEAPEGMYN